MEAAQTAAAESRQARVALVHHLVAGGHVGAGVVARCAAEEFGDPLIDLNTFSKDMMVKDLVDPKLITKHTILPLLRRGSRLFVAVSDPTNLPALEEIRFNTGLNVETVIAEDDKLRPVLKRISSSAGRLVGSDTATNSRLPRRSSGRIVCLVISLGSTRSLTIISLEKVFRSINGSPNSSAAQRATTPAPTCPPATK